MIGLLKKGENPWFAFRISRTSRNGNQEAQFFCLKQDKPLIINFCKFLNTRVHCLKKRHKENSVLNPLCSDSALLVNKAKNPYRILRGWVTPFKVLVVTGFKKGRIQNSFKKHRTRSIVGLDWIKLWITEKLNFHSVFSPSRTAFLPTWKASKL